MTDRDKWLSSPAENVIIMQGPWCHDLSAMKMIFFLLVHVVLMHTMFPQERTWVNLDQNVRITAVLMNCWNQPIYRGYFTIHNAWYLQSPWLPTLFHILGKSVSSFTWMFSIRRNWSMLAMRARLVPVIFRSGLTLPWTTCNASMLFLLEDRCTGLISHVESPICSRWEVRMQCKSRRTESRRNKWSRNKSEVDEQQRETWLKNQEWRTTETWMSKT
jgi:hypothetical protein